MIHTLDKVKNAQLTSITPHEYACRSTQQSYRTQHQIKHKETCANPEPPNSRPLKNISIPVGLCRRILYSLPPTPT